MKLSLRKHMLVAPLILFLIQSVGASEIDRLIEQLSSDKFAVRETAEKEVRRDWRARRPSPTEGHAN